VTAAIETSGLTKVYGATRALDGVDLTVPQGSVYGFLGPNGAGKTTTLRILTGLARSTSGSVKVLGQDVATATNEVRSLVGYLPDVPGFYPWMTAPEFLRFAGSLFGLSGSALDDRCAALLDLAGLADVASPIGGYSRGMKQRLGVAQALVNAPKLLMLDEPTSALDPLGRKQVLDMIASLAGRTTVFFSTHILADVERVCDTVAVLDRGRVVAQSSISELKSRYGASKVVVEVAGDAAVLAQRLRSEPWLADLGTDESGALQLKVTDIAAAEKAVPAAVAELGLGLRRMEAGEVDLEEVFVELVGQRR
jgi:ABC-2 type transport system ATP-binding protein